MPQYDENDYRQVRIDREAYHAAKLNSDNAHVRKLVYVVLGLVAFLIFAFSTGCPHYNVWSQEMSGKAELAKAEQNRQIQVADALGKSAAAKELAAAEVARARGVAEANQIIGDSLKGNEAYLRYLWIDSIGGGKSSIIYIPTEAGLPIMEAGHRPSTNTAAPLKEASR